MAIFRDTFVRKLSFVLFGSAEQAAIVELEATLAEYRHRFSLAEPTFQIPPRNECNTWFAGKPVDKKYFHFFSALIEREFAKSGFYDSLSPDRKKVFKQLRAFVQKEVTAQVQTIGGRHPSTRPPLRQLADVKLILLDLEHQLQVQREEIQRNRANSEDAQDVNDKSLEIIELILPGLVDVKKAIDTSLNSASESSSRNLDRVLSEVSMEFKNWIHANKPELVDAVLRLTPASVFIGILSLAGANMSWATPIVLALCGGEKIVEVLRKLKH